VSPQPVLQVHELTKRFTRRRTLRRDASDGVVAVDGVSAEVERGRTLGVVGESGSGKTTLARMLVGLSRPTAGHVLLDGTDIAELSPPVLHRRIQYVFQDPYSSLNPRKTVAQSIDVPLRYLTDAVRPERRRRIAQLLEQTGLRPEFADRYPHQLSGGQRQRVVIARAIAARPDVLVLDEPVSALDVSIQAQIIALLRALQHELQLAYVFISHDLAVVEKLCDEAMVMHEGAVVERGCVGDIFSGAVHPYTRRLLAAIPGRRLRWTQAEEVG
jgi:ABC-type glutathione transport system ATPase component